MNDELEALQQEWDDFGTNGSIDIVTLMNEIEDLKEALEFIDEDNNEMWDNNQRDEINAMIVENENRIAELQSRRIEIKNSIKDQKKAVAKVKKELDTYRTKRGKRGEVRARMERALRKHGIDRPAYHGGDLTGVKVKVLLQKIDVIFGDEFEQILLEVPVNERLATNDEVKTMISMYTDLGFVMDGLFSQARIRSGSLKDEDVALMRRFVNATLKMWRFLRHSMAGQKIHICEDHILIQMVKWGGFGNFTEDFVEQGHQFGVKDEARTKGLKRSKAFKSHSNWEWQTSRQEVMIARMIMKMKTCRGGRQKTEDDADARKDQRVKNRMDSLLQIEADLYQIISNFRLAG